MTLPQTTFRSLCLLGVFFLFPQAASALDHVVDLSATAATQPAAISLKWNTAPSRGISYQTHTVYRKAPAGKEWGPPLAKLDGKALTYLDNAIQAGQAYEYQIIREGTVGGETPLLGYGYACCGVNVPAIEDRGQVLLLVDARHAEALKDSLITLEQDLTGDGWTVIRRDIAPTLRDHDVKDLIQKQRDKDPDHLRALFILGHIAVPYSGNINPDGHPDHKGAWPADMYYGDLSGTWSDTVVDTTANGILRSPSNKNVPGDGKWDPDNLPADGQVVLDIGRVDLQALPTMTVAGKESDEAGLLRHYLAKNHRYRHNLAPFTEVRRRVIFDDLYLQRPRAYTAAAGTADALFGPDTFDAADWMQTLPTLSYLWAFGQSTGDYSRINGVITTSQLSHTDLKTVFSMVMGSYSGDWDTPHNVMRAMIASGDHCLTCCWGGPKWYFHHMAMGETIGYSTRITQNNRGFYANPLGAGRSNLSLAMVHIALLGDPTLRLFPVTPPAGLQVQKNADHVLLNWQASPEKILGYYVYRGDTGGSPYRRISPELIPGLNFTDPHPAATGASYMVRAIKLETSGSGTYLNASQGIFAKQF